ncbi:beta-ketoacyl-ACP synthase III [Falsarthrobacter nasiphocae]|uniref:Beta-ketoacyl-[acyl-carrier-protein] synthase III n=1 Tax=Falsarthrobacter nasiphocae TaxID=189863 RepID=A0AAE3YHL8_9MICC|nr:beta-ketoacyl-ACP synthase III [Falsarthrobacter nasiphocae]MDR6892877.1 3-oxoacyl-[acyl-carrier-protein] synthase-3 [Falsarthrobacter nasiphocae]
MSATLKQYETVQHSRIAGVGEYRGQNVVTNDDIVEPINSSDEWIRQRTGIATRRRAAADVSVVDMAEAASLQALEHAGLTAEDIEAVVVSTVTHPFATPSAAALLASRLGTGVVPAFDVSAACAGYCYGVAQADALVRSGMAKNVLVVGVEKLSDFIDPTDRTISFLLGDAAGAVVVTRSETPGISRSVWGSEGGKWDAIGMTHSLLDVRSGANPAWPTLRQDGPSVFRWAVWEMAKMARKALDEAGVTAEDLAVFLPHQANMRIIDEMVKQLKLPESVLVARDIEDTGNTSAASIPIAMRRMLDEHPEVSGKLALQIGFGAGLVFGAQVVVLP